jgi:hypothetical protein
MLRQAAHAWLCGGGFITTVDVPQKLCQLASPHALLFQEQPAPATTGLEPYLVVSLQGLELGGYRGFRATQMLSFK